MKMRKSLLALAVAITFTVATFLPVSGAFKIGDIFKVGGIALLVKTFAEPLNSFINTALMNKKLENKEATKVVPIVSFGEGTHVGAAQVSGPKKRIDEVKAVAALDTDFTDRKFRIKILIPINTVNPLDKNMKRVYSVGVSAIIDIKV